MGAYVGSANGTWIALGVVGAVAAAGAALGRGGSMARNVKDGSEGTPRPYTFDVEGNKIPAISFKELMNLPNGTVVYGMLPFGTPATAVLRNGKLKVTSHKVPRNFDDFSPSTVMIDGVTYGIP